MLPPPSVRSALAAYRARLELAYPGRIRSLILFGSVARGEAHEGSDVDVLVRVDRLGPRERAAIIDEGARVGFETGLPLVPLVLADDEWEHLVQRERLLPIEIARDGIEA